MKKLFLSILLVLYFVAVHGQERHTLDSLKNLLAKAKPDTNKVWLYYKIVDQYVWSYPDSCLQYADAGLNLADGLHFNKGKELLLGYSSYALAQKGNYPQALASVFEGLRFADTLGDKTAQAAGIRQLGDIYGDAHDYTNALRYYQKYKATAPRAFYKQWEWLFTNGVGTVYLAENKLDSALFYENWSYNFVTKAGGNWPPPMIALAEIYEKLGNYSRAVYFGSKGLKFSYYKGDIISASKILADVYRHAGKADSSIFYAKKALAVSNASAIQQMVPDIAGLLTDDYKKMHQPDSTLKYEDIMLAAKDAQFSREKVVQMQNVAFQEQEQQQEATEKAAKYRNRLLTFGLLIIIVAVLAIAVIIWRGSKLKQKDNLLLNEQKEEIAAQRDNLEQALSDLKSTQAQLIQSEKMASLGELTAGIAHEIQNPLNFVNNFSDVNREMIGELKAELKGGNLDEALVIADDIEQNEQKINHHGKRADSIVKGMLEHSRSGSGQKEPIDLNAMADEYMRLAYHGLRAKDKAFNAELVTNFDSKLPRIDVIPQDVGRVLLNLFNNAFYAVNQKQKTADKDYKPEVSVTTYSENNHITIKVKDNGIGIPDTIKAKIMQPFFTTKPTGEGTGLGLSLTYDMVVKGHGGSIQVNSVEGEETEFIISLPSN